MANALQQGNTPPPAPNPQGQDQNGLQPSPMNSGPSPMAGQGQQQAPAPTHAQTVAALRHFDAIKKELETLLKIPTLGKSDIKSQIIEGTTKLVGDRILTPAQAVMELSKVPDNPIEQKKWVQQNYMQTMQAENAVLEHHRAAFAGTDGQQDQQYDPEQHAMHMDGLMSHYKGNGGG